MFGKRLGILLLLVLSLVPAAWAGIERIDLQVQGMT